MGQVHEGGERCPECGAPLGEVASCDELFHAALVMEWVDPPVTSVAHHLLVATYMVQHPSGFTEEGARVMRDTLATSVDEGLSAPELRERNRGRYDQQVRDFKLKARDPREPVPREWHMTIADAVDGPAEELPARVRRWAESVRAEL